LDRKGFWKRFGIENENWQIRRFGDPIGEFAILVLGELLMFLKRKFPKINANQQTFTSPQDEIVFDTIAPSPPLPVPLQDAQSPPASHTTRISLPMQSGNPRLSLTWGIGSNTQPGGFSPVSLSTARTWNTGSSTNPNWDEYRRDNFSYTMKCKAAAEQERCSDTSLYPQGVSWSEFTVNLQDVQIHPLAPSPLGTVSASMIQLHLRLAPLTHSQYTHGSIPQQLLLYPGTPLWHASLFLLCA
jgi:hypothetical protein